MSRKGARWFRANVCSRPSAVTRLVFQRAARVVDEYVDSRKGALDLIGQAAYLGLRGQVREEGVHLAAAGGTDVLGSGLEALRGRDR